MTGLHMVLVPGEGFILSHVPPKRATLQLNFSNSQTLVLKPWLFGPCKTFIASYTRKPAISFKAPVASPEIVLRNV